MNKFFQTIVVLLSFMIFSGASAPAKLYYIAPSQIPNTYRQMNTAGFWISLHPNPDQVILTPSEISKFNRVIREEQKLIRDITEFSAVYSGEDLKKKFETQINEFAEQKYYLGTGKYASQDFFEIQLKLMNLDLIDEDVHIRYGLVVHYADQRFLPTEEGLYAEVNDINFDEVQNSTLDVGSPVVVLHESSDGKWVYTFSSSSEGWVEKDLVAFCDRNDWLSFQKSKRVIITSAKADIYLNQERTEYYDYARMGAFFGLKKSSANVYTVAVPLRNSQGNVDFKTGFISKEDAHAGYLSYTPRTIFNQAFKLLNAPYGWGGMYGEQDCSAFLQEIFSTVGIELPRDSKAQAKIGKPLGDFDEDDLSKKWDALLTKAIPGATLLRLKGHIMLYLGMSGQNAYAIHAAWAYREKGNDEDRVRVLNRVVVTDLSLGDGSKRGSFLRKIIKIIVVQ